MIIPLFLSSLLAVLLESSLISWPWVIWVSWWWSNRVNIEKLLWVTIFMGIILDILLIRLIGLSGVLLWLFILGLLILRQWFSGGAVMERIYVVSVSVMWAYILGGIRGWISVLLIIGLTLGLMIFKVAERFRWEVKLRN